VTATLIEGQWRRSVTNIGVRPTFGDALAPAVETHVINWAGDLYGDVLRVRFLHRLREEQKFGSIDELKGQIERDVTRAERYFEHAGVKRSLVIV
jgi:riboflavin kinase/FMN adenylyltransferase